MIFLSNVILYVTLLFKKVGCNLAGTPEVNFGGWTVIFENEITYQANFEKYDYKLGYKEGNNNFVGKLYRIKFVFNFNFHSFLL